MRRNWFVFTLENIIFKALYWIRSQLIVVVEDLPKVKCKLVLSYWA